MSPLSINGETIIFYLRLNSIYHLISFNSHLMMLKWNTTYPLPNSGPEDKRSQQYRLWYAKWTGLMSKFRKWHFCTIAPYIVVGGILVGWVQFTLKSMGFIPHHNVPNPIQPPLIIYVSLWFWSLSHQCPTRSHNTKMPRKCFRWNFSSGCFWEKAPFLLALWAYIGPLEIYSKVVLLTWNLSFLPKIEIDHNGSGMK